MFIFYHRFVLRYKFYLYDMYVFIIFWIKQLKNNMSKLVRFFRKKKSKRNTEQEPTPSVEEESGRNDEQQSVQQPQPSTSTSTPQLQRTASQGK